MQTSELKLTRNETQIAFTALLIWFDLCSHALKYGGNICVTIEHLLRFDENVRSSGTHLVAQVDTSYSGRVAICFVTDCTLLFGHCTNLTVTSWMGRWFHLF